MSTENTRTTSFRSADDEDRARSSAELVPRRQAAYDAAQLRATADEAAAIADPTDRTLERAKASRRACDDAKRDLAFVLAHAASVARDVSANELAAMRTTVARLKSCITPIVDDGLRLKAAEAAAAARSLHRSMLARLAQHRADLEEVRALSVRAGENVEDVPSPEALMSAAAKELTEIGLATQAQLGICVQDVAGTFAYCLPFFREGGAPWQAKEYAAGHNYSDRQAHADSVIATAAKLLERVKSRGESIEKGKSGGATAAAALVALAVASSALLAGG